jgi:hypothetical protein
MAWFMKMQEEKRAMSNTTESSQARFLNGGVSQRWIRALVLGELLFLLPLHMFWAVFKSTPFAAENLESGLVALLPFAVMISGGLLMQFRMLRAAFLRIEWVLHLTAAILLALLLWHITLRDPFDPAWPITWPLVFWSIAMAFLALAGLVTLERLREGGEATFISWKAGIAQGVLYGALLLWIASGAVWLPYFLTVSAVFHALRAPASRTACRAVMQPVMRRPARMESATAFLEGLTAAVLVFLALMHHVFLCDATGTAELRFPEFIRLLANGWFLAGALIAYAALRLRILPLSHALAAMLLWGFGKSGPAHVPFILGYGLVSVFAAAWRQGPLAMALTIPAMAAVWLLGALGFMAAGVILVYDMGLGVLNLLLDGGLKLLPLIYGVWLIVLLAPKSWRVRRAAEALPLPPIPPGRRILLYGSIWSVMLGAVLLLAVFTMWPPTGFDRADQVDAGEMSGVCHAGYSKSEIEYDALEKLGVRMMRIDFHWARIQKDPETWDFSYYDGYVETANEEGMPVLGLLVFDNNNVEQAPEGQREGPYIAPADVPLYLEYIRRTVSRYKGRVQAWELWNEPDISRFWTGTMAEMYDLTRQAAAVVREADPEVTLLSPAMTSPLGAIWSAAGIEGLHKSGALEKVDHQAMHTYVSDPRAYYNEYYRVKNAMAKYGHPGGVWITELGDPDGGVYPWRASPERLAEHAVKSHVIAASLGIEKLVWYCFKSSTPEDQRIDPANSERFFGIVDWNYDWKPAAHAYNLFAEYCNNSTIRNDLLHLSGGIAARQLRTALFRRENGESALVLWFEPALRPGAHARVRFAAGAFGEDAVIHDITSDYTKLLLDEVIDVTEKPVFITFTAPDPDAAIELEAIAYPADAAWLIVVSGLVLWSMRKARKS